MKFNALYLFWVLAFLACFWLKDHFMGRNNLTFFGATETESRSLNYDHTVVIRELRVRTGDKVKAGDTLMLFSRTELDQESAERQNDLNSDLTEKNAKNKILFQSQEVLKAEYQAKLSELQAQIRMEEAEFKAESGVRKILGENNDPSIIDPLRAEKIEGLRTQIRQAELEYTERLKELQSERQANESLYNARNTRIQTDLNFVRSDRQRLFLIAPVDGFVETITAGVNEVVPQHKELLKINPLQPTRIRGFIYEAAEVVYTLGDTVQLTAYSRSKVQASGIIIGSNPQVVELPVRLRKVPEMRTWGREIFISLPSGNPFYLNEKIIIAFP